ncbi:MAG: hypothetical protein U1F65_03575 [Verrucomicrobiota bacterium]
MRPFGYWRDRLFLTGCALYALNRWWIKPHVHGRFLHSYFNDLLLIPCALPLVLLLQRLLRLRLHDRAPQPGEIVFHVAVWSVICEVLAPHFLPRLTGDPWDVVAYGLGGLLAGCWWRWWENRPRTAAS